MSVPRAFGDDARAVARQQALRGRIDRDDDEAGKLANRAQRLEHSSSMIVASARRSSGLKAGDSRCFAPSIP